MNLCTDIKSIKGIGDKTASLFSKASIFSIGDLISYFPISFIKPVSVTDIKDITPGQTCAVYAQVASGVRLFSSKGRSVLSFEIKDDLGGMIKVTYFNMPYLKNKFVKGAYFVFYGMVSKDKPSFTNPKLFDKLTDYQAFSESLIPVYPLVKGLSSNKISAALNNIKDDLELPADFADADLLNKYNLVSLKEAYTNIHFPSSFDDAENARRRLAFNEFLVFFHNCYKLKGDSSKNNTDILIPDCKNDISAVLSQLPYKLTKGQLDALNDIAADLKSGYRMNRLLQGDVGCGKTIVALLTSYMTILGGYQAAIMAPTVVLATQHYENALEMDKLYHTSLRPVLLTGSMKAAERREALQKISSGEAGLIIGTHALFTDNVQYHSLGLSICDEQHRFGVAQRLGLMNKGNDVHQLVMSATPIPRTLGLILYGDMDISVIPDKPSDRLPIKNAVVGPQYRRKNYKFIEERIREGRQAYIICPMVEEGNLDNVKNVEDYYDEIRPVFSPDIRIGTLHGRMKDSEKDAVMTEFKNHNLDILISTTVIEVGVNVPNATVMMIENAERFGLSQLHQLRGRVGRGEYQSYVIFVSESTSVKNTERLKLLSSTNDGFEIASKDLKMRGPGDFFGYRQSGLPMFKMADIISDSDILKDAKEVFDNSKSDKEFITNLCSFENYFNSFDRDYLCL